MGIVRPRIGQGRRGVASRGPLVALLVAFALLAASMLHAMSEAHARDDFGVLVMAHGGNAAWNREVEAMLAPLHRDYALELALGMADAATLQEGVSRLETRGVRRIAVVRLFVSGESWRERTEQILGLSPGAPAKPEHGPGHGHHDDPEHGMAFWQIDTTASFALSNEGLADAPEAGQVLAERAQDLSRDPTMESVLILAHGPEDDAENQRWLAKIDARADAVRQALPYRRVQVETLREDWPDKRKPAEARIRAFVMQASSEGGRAIVVPFRVQGFGPYAKVLEGLEYASDGKGLIPSIQVEQWVRRQIEDMRGGPFRTPQR